MLTESQARDNLRRLIQQYSSIPLAERKEMTEADVVHRFIDPLLEQVLGWTTERRRYELHTEIGRPDVTLTPEKGAVIFVEAKRFGVIKELAQVAKSIEGIVKPGQMALPGMAGDRTREEQQAINYAFENGGEFAILTNFEKLRLFNARRDWMVLSFEDPTAYLHDFELLWQLSYANVIKGSLEDLSRQRYREEVDTKYLAFINEWREKLAQDIVRHPDKNRWAFEDDGRVKLATLRNVVQRYLDRLVILRFAEDHLVLPAGTLQSMYELVSTNPYTFTMAEFLHRAFRMFDKDHNSALFAMHLTDQASFSDEMLLPLIGKLYEARYRSMPADIMGNTYEQYLGKALVQRNGQVVTADNLETRKKQGSYYTPQVIVRYIVDNSLGRYLYGTADGKPDGALVEGETRKTSADIKDLRLLDSACGSGSFLIYAYYVLRDFYESEIKRLETERVQKAEKLYQSGASEMDVQFETAALRVELERITLKPGYPRLILETHIYGVDLDPQAAEIAVVNLMMRAMEGRAKEKRLPLLLNQNVKVGNGLIGVRHDDSAMAEHADALAKIQQLRRDLVESDHGSQHDQIIRDLEAAAQHVNDQLNTRFAPHFSDLERVRPFNWGVEFPEVFFDAEGKPLDNPGFTIIFGNPPWEIVKPDIREFYAQFDENIESRYNRAQVEKRIAELSQDPLISTAYEAQNQNITAQAAYFRAAPDYVRQGRGDTATHKLFVERMYGLLRDQGRLGYVVPSGIYTDLGTKDLREMLLNEGNIQYIFSFSNERFFFPGVHHSFKFVLLGVQKGQQTEGFWATFRFNPRVAVKPDDLPSFLDDRNNLVYIESESIKKFNPESLLVLEFKSQAEYDIAERLYTNAPALSMEIPNSWNVKFTREFDKTNDRDLFNYSEDGLPVYQGENLAFYGEVLRLPSIWIKEQKGKEKLLGTIQRQLPVFNGKIPLDYEYYRFGFRRIARSTDIRTLIVSYIPKHSFAMYTLTTTVKHYFDGTEFKRYMTDKEEMFLYACMASFPLDFLMRFQVASSVAMFNAYSMPVPRLQEGNTHFDSIVPRAARLTCTRPEFADLWQSVMGTQWTPESGATDPATRQTLRDEIDALVAHLYGLTRAEFDHILSTFPLVFPDTPAGQSRRAALLTTFDTIAAAIP